VKTFPRLDILPPEQRRLWPELAQVGDEAFVLYGGTAVALYLGHRESIDFDFFTDQTFLPEQLLAKFRFLNGAEVLQTQRDTLTVFVSTESNESHRVKISFFGGFTFGRLADPERTPDGNLEVASLQDLLAHKLKVLLQRVEMKDYLDIDALLQNGMDLAQGCAGARAMFAAFSPQECLKALTYFNDSSLQALSVQLKQRLVTAAAGVKSIPDVRVKSKELSMRR